MMMPQWWREAWAWAVWALLEAPLLLTWRLWLWWRGLAPWWRLVWVHAAPLVPAGQVERCKALRVRIMLLLLLT
jgi:hypothetical protein